MKAISHFIRQFRCWLRKPGASTAADTSAPVSQPQGHSLWGSALPRAMQHDADHGWQHGKRNQRGLQGTRVARLRAASCGPPCSHMAPGNRAAGRLVCSEPAQPGSVGELKHHACNRSSAGAGCVLQPRAATLLLLGSPAPLLPCPLQPCCTRTSPRHPAVRGRVWVWEPGLGASLAAAFLSRLPAAWVPQQSQWAHRHLGTQPSSPRSRCLHLEMCFAAPHPARSHCRVPRDRHAPQSRGERSLTCHHPALRHVAGLAPCTLGTRLCAVTPHGWTLSKYLHVQDMNQPGRECSSRSWTTRAARQAAPAARLCWCQTSCGSAGRLQSAAPARLHCHLADQPRAWRDPGLARISLPLA